MVMFIVWDLRAFKKPLATHTGLATLYPTTNAIFSPDDKYILTGAGATSKGEKGRLMFLKKDGLELVKELVVDTTPVKVLWHSKINQVRNKLIVSVVAYLPRKQIVTGLASGQICVLYSPLTSLNGAKLLLNKGPPRKATIEDMSDALSAPTIITPHALPMFRDGEDARGSKRKREKDRMDPRKSRRPELPVTGPGKGGRVGASATQHVVQNLVRDTTRDEDVRTLFADILMVFSQIMPASGLAIQWMDGLINLGAYDVRACSSISHSGLEVVDFFSRYLESSALVPSQGLAFASWTTRRNHALFAAGRRESPRPEALHLSGPICSSLLKLTACIFFDNSPERRYCAMLPTQSKTRYGQRVGLFRLNSHLLIV